ncbi:MAG: NACHT domain-containing protein [Richelia sp. SM1_7_0]|nr:NACHT domain-containing protein [Richelia sp. SM1_7_0]
MTKANYSQFKTYLQSISEKYKCWWNLYTLTDAEGKKQEKQLSSPFDFGLMVETLQPKQEQEKAERLPVLEGIRKYAQDRVLLVGKPGSGKSTALARLLLEEAEKPTPIEGEGLEEEWSIPVLVELRYWQTSVFERIQAFLQQHDANLNLDETSLKTLLRQGKLLLLIDGVNELPSEDARRQVAVFRKDYPQTSMIFTTRDLVVGGDLGIEKKLEMQPLNETQMREFVMAYLPQQGEELLQRLGSRLREFGKTPLLLWMLCSLFQQTGNIPPNLGMVFRLFTQNYESNWRGDVAVTAESRRWWKSLLEHLAFVMMRGQPVTEFRVAIPKREVEEIFTKYLDAEKLDKPRDYAKCWLEDLLKHHLIQVGSGDKIEFRHQLLQEYYAAEYLLRQLPHINDAKLQHDYLNLLKWTEPVALMLALVEDEAQVLRVVRLALDVDLMLGARFAGEVKPEFHKKTVDLVSEQKLKNGQEVTNWLQVQLFGKTRSQAAIAYLQQFLQSPDSDVRRIAVWVLRQVGEPAIDVLFKVLKHPDSGVREAAISALGEIGNDIVIPKLIEMLEDSEPDVRQKAIFSLEKLDCETVIPGLLKVIQDPVRNVKQMAKLALKKMNRKVVISASIKALQNPDSSIRKNAADTLGEIGNETAIYALSKLEEDVDLDFSLRVKYALFKLQNKSVKNESKSHQNNQEVQGNQELEKKEKIIKSLKNLEHRDHILRGNAIVDLISLDCKQAIPKIIDALKDPSAHVRSNAITGIGIFFNKFPEYREEIKTVIHTLIEVLRDSSSHVRSVAAITLSSIGSEEAIPPLIEGLKDSDSLVRASVTQALGKFISEKTIPALVQSLQDKDLLVRESAGEALAKVKGHNIEQYLPYLLI